MLPETCADTPVDEAKEVSPVNEDTYTTRTGQDVAGCWFVKVLIDDSVLFCTLDTGSMVTIISTQCYKHLSQAFRSELRPTTTKLVSADGSPLCVEGVADFDCFCG